MLLYYNMFSIENIKNSIEKSINSLNRSKYVFGILMIISNIMSKYISVKFTKVQEAYIKNLLGRQILIFTIAFIASKDVVVSLILTLAFILFIDYLLNEDSKYCIIPHNIQIKIRELEDSLFLDDEDEIPSEADIQRAHKIIEKANSIDHKKQKEKNKYLYSMMYLTN
jgi:hypothetical protein